MTCPYCKSENRPGAVKCAACGSWTVDNPPVREWYRAREGRMIAGVGRGLANRFGAPVAAVRLLLIASLLLGGWGLLVYLALWISMPIEPGQELLTAGPPPMTREAPPPSAAA
jgi:phage shock protein C